MIRCAAHERPAARTVEMQLLTLRSVLVATDLTETSRPALSTAARLASQAGANLHLLHVMEAPRGDREGGMMREFRAAAPESRDPETVRVVTGSPSAAIVEYALESAADVVVLGAHRRRETGAPLGSTARSVVVTAQCPCLVAGTELRLPLQRVMVPISVSGVTSGALLVALSWASALRTPGADADLVVLHVTVNPDPETVREAVHGQVVRARQRTYDAARVDVAERIIHGHDPAAAILREGASWSPDLLIMGTRARGTDGELGSVSAAVVQETPCPLLLVPPAVWQRLDAPT
jgi:nucleotide-binding universal stress UspA family protein